MTLVLVTGADGFIGSHLTYTLLKQNNNVVVIDNYETGRRDNLKEHSNLTVVEGSIVDRDLIFKLVQENEIN